MIETLRNALTSFWNEHLHIERCPEGWVLCLPMMYSDGLQVIIYLRQVTPNKCLLSDQGATLSLLSEANVSLKGSSFTKILASQAKIYGFEQMGLQLEKVIDLPVQAADIQIFAEGLVSLSHMVPKQEKAYRANVEQLMADRLHAFFYNRKLEPKRRYELAGRVEKKITVEYFVENHHRLALQPISTTTNLLSTMERWGWKWTDLRAADPSIIRAMVYDPDNQPWDEASLNIGQSVCEVFVPYTESDAAIGRALSA